MNHVTNKEWLATPFEVHDEEYYSQVASSPRSKPQDSIVTNFNVQAPPLQNSPVTTAASNESVKQPQPVTILPLKGNDVPPFPPKPKCQFLEAFDDTIISILKKFDNVIGDPDIEFVKHMEAVLGPVLSVLKVQRVRIDTEIAERIEACVTREKNLAAQERQFVRRKVACNKKEKELVAKSEDHNGFCYRTIVKIGHHSRFY
ncbi:hypothetical protein BOTCAL_0170g00100 [Botryotinia calthae]|uniref:Uncharacterized protein n=1 Tax=Botryotinia calthae TaxID=38488 RepID=A0A4Y8D3J4_9HELO|nr:hypothetical protein BOTCAL_0170g00100 [Botryotinia calthae]